MPQRPLRQCHKIGCTNLTREKYCDDHKHLYQEETRQWNKYYDTYKRDQEAKAFYNSKEWQRMRRKALVRDRYLCQPCLRHKRITPADIVHHIVPIKDDWSKRLDINNLESICFSCHNSLHASDNKSE